MRVLFVSPNLGTGGAERQWSIMIPGLVERGLEVFVLTLDGEGLFFDRLREAGVATRCARFGRRADVAAWRRALALRSYRPDLIVSQGVSAAYVGQALKLLTHAPHVTTVHKVHGHHLLQTPHQRTLTRLMAPHFDGVIAVTKMQVPFLVGMGYRPERIRVINNGLPELVASRPRSAVRSELGLSDTDFAVALVAALRPEKRAADFVAALARAHQRNSRIRGLVAGGGPGLEPVRALAAAADGAVQILGERSDVADLISASDAVCLSSAIEAFPMTLLEGMALAKPLVSTAVGGAGEIVIEGETGFLVEPGNPPALADAIVRLAADLSLARRMGEEGQTRQRRLFTADVMNDNYAHSFAAFAASRNGAGFRSRATEMQ